MPRSSTTSRAARWLTPRRWTPDLKKGDDKKVGANRATATRVGKLVAQRAKAKGIAKVVFDRGGYIYHGTVRALADAAREGGLEF